jgi:CheY-like chemotaxis protein
MIKILIVENNATTSSMLADTLSTCTNVSTRLATQPSTASQLVKSEGFDVVLIDLKLTDSNETGPGTAIYNGIQLGGDLRQALPGAIIVLYSGDITPGREKEFTYYEDCLRTRADYVLGRETLLSKGSTTWSDTLQTWIAAKRAEQAAARPLDCDDDWNTLALVETVGKDCLSQLIRLAIPDMSRDKVRALHPGFSGAFVCSVASTTLAGGRSVILILKIAKSLLPLTDELRRRPTPGSVLDRYATVPHSRCVNWQDWYAVSLRPVRDAMLLRDFLFQKGRARDKAIFSNLITELLVPSAKEAVPSPGTATDNLLGYASGSEMLNTLRTVSAWRKLPCGDIAKKDVTTVERFIERCLQGHWTVSGNYQLSRLHGDFHCRNVFVSEAGKMDLIDFGESNELPRLLDFATLDADLLLSVLGSKQGGDLDFKKIKGWYTYAVKGFPFRSKPETNATESRIQLLRRLLHKHLLADLDDVTTIEYSEALLLQCLRYMRFVTTTAPKKILAVLLAAQLIRQHGLDVD